MIASPQFNYLSHSEYLHLEEQSDLKREYIGGEVYAMAGASDRHVTISLNLASCLREHLRGSGCRVYMSDMKAKIETANRFFYPDVMVTYDDRDKSTSNYKQYPCLIVEVLSNSTEAFDRGDKFSDYQQFHSLQEYILISTNRQKVDCFRRNDNGLWVLQPYSIQNPLVQIQSVNLEVDFATIYEDVEF
ncbi:Uma2 family endonuclease [Chamaesiphon sp.]|uniref:Uma2 family endonuclease n=1 Tax=Chamaesiphon sp. TaxID=2814140 RepID=UPI0035932E1D